MIIENRNENINKDINWLKYITRYMGIKFHTTSLMTTFCASEEMKNILSSYGAERLYVSDIEKIIEIAEMLT
jgi:hypothetical protein